MNQKYKAFAWLCRLFIAGLFIFAGVVKIIDPMNFAKQIAAYEILPDHLVNISAIVLPWIEVYAGLAVILPLRHIRNAGALLCLGMMLVFIWAQIDVLNRGLNIECGCFGKGEKVSWPGVGKRMGYAVAALFALIGPYADRDE